jgi:hypothetical protein
LRSKTSGYSINWRRRNRDLVEALERQTATSEILRVISQSPIDVQPIFVSSLRACLRVLARQKVAPRHARQILSARGCGTAARF